MVDIEYYQLREAEIGSAGLMPVGRANETVDGRWVYGIGSSYGADYGDIDGVSTRRETMEYYQTQRSQEGDEQGGCEEDE